MTKMISRLFVMETTLISSISTKMEANGNDHGYWGWKWGGGNDHYPYGDNIVPFPPAVSLRGKVVVRQLTHDDSFPASQ